MPSSEEIRQAKVEQVKAGVGVDSPAFVSRQLRFRVITGKDGLTKFEIRGNLPPTKAPERDTSQT